MPLLENTGKDFFLISPPTAHAVMLKFKLANTSSGSAIYTTLPHVHVKTLNLTVEYAFQLEAYI